jgi:deazaflavin-dependent oxidoreductase (nitroreductase family)
MASWLAFTRAHCAIYRGTRGLIGANLLGIQMLLLTTRGRKTGKTRTLPLAYVEVDGDFVIAASNGGADFAPTWWLNLQAAETAEIQVRGERIAVGWEVVPPEEKMGYWRRLQAAIPAYRIYRTRTEREIPIVRLRRLDGGWKRRPLAATSSGAPATVEAQGPPESARARRARDPGDTGAPDGASGPCGTPQSGSRKT